MYNCAADKGQLSQAAEVDNLRYQTARQDSWDFGTVSAQDGQAIIDKRNRSYSYSESSEDEAPMSDTEGANYGGSHDISVDPYATVKEVRKIDLNANLTVQPKKNQAIRNPDRESRVAVGSSSMPKHVSGHLSGHDDYIPGREAASWTLRNTGPTRNLPNSNGNLPSEVSSPAVCDDRTAQSQLFANLLLPVMAQLRAQATGYPIALKSIDKLQACLTEVENETNGLVETFIMNLVQTSNLLDD